ncbi:MAG: toll/interleukin-1 receptor domain-containing protein [Gemmatimonadales bacterium]
MSHSVEDRDVVLRLTNYLNEACQGSVKFFVAIRDLPPGVNWEQAIFAELDKADLVIAVFSAKALESNWVLFETGFARGRDKVVVPIGLPGQSVAAIPRPVGSLQGYDVHSASGIGKVIRVLNQHFGHAHPAEITPADFRRVVFGSRLPEEVLDPPTSGPYRVFSQSSGDERPHELVTIVITDEAMSARTDRWESTGYIAEGRYVGRFKYHRGLSPNDVGTHEFIWTGVEFVGRAVPDSEKWENETLVWRPEPDRT